MDANTIGAVWQKAREIPGFSSLIWRWDDFGRVIRYTDYGNRQSQWGWEIDHITPKSEGGDRPFVQSSSTELGPLILNVVDSKQLSQSSLYTSTVSRPIPLPSAPFA